MNNPEEIKRLLSPIMVAERYLGQGRQKGNKIWYKSPFRNERTASFMVDNKSFHDFGDSWDGDIINFIERYYNTDFINAMKILSNDFGLPEDDRKSKEFESYIKRQREEEQLMKKNLDNWFNNTFIKVCEELKVNEKRLKNRTILLSTGYNRDCTLNILWEYFFNAVNDYDKKIELWKDKEEIEKWITDK